MGTLLRLYEMPTSLKEQVRPTFGSGKPSERSLVSRVDRVGWLKIPLMFEAPSVIDIGLCLLVLLGKWRQNSLYLYKWRPTAKGSLLVPNSSAAFSIFSGIFCIVAEPYLWLTVKMQHSERILPVAFKAQNNCMAVVSDSHFSHRKLAQIWFSCSSGLSWL